MPVQIHVATISPISLIFMDRTETPHDAILEEISVPPPTPPPASSGAGASNETRSALLLARSQRPSIRVLRRPSAQLVTRLSNLQGDNIPIQHNVVDIRTRRRSSSEPQQRQIFGEPSANTMPTAAIYAPMSPVAEEPSKNVSPQLGARPQLSRNRTKLRRASVSALSSLGLIRASTVNGPEVEAASNRLPNEYDTGLVDLLDVVDPEISTLTTLTNVQNSLFIPDLGNFLNRRPLYSLTPRLYDESSTEQERESDQETLDTDDASISRRLRLQSSRSAVIDELCFAILPDGETLTGWSEAEKLELNDHVRHMLHSRRSKFKRSMKGFCQYARKPLGFLVTLYATLITLFGLAWVLFLIGWINVGGRQLYIINVIDNVLVALFAVVGDGLAPFRAIDTYHMIFVAHYARLTWRLRREKELPKLENKNDLPVRTVDNVNHDIDVEMATPNKANDNIHNGDNREKDKPEEYSVLTPKQQKRLEHHQEKLSKSHTFYKPHETTTHTAFPLRLLVATIVLLDFHSLFQIALGACTWGIYYKVRPFALTTVILCCSISCNVAAGIVIWIGGRRTRKIEVIEKMFRQELTQEAIKKVDKKRKNDKERKSMDERWNTSKDGSEKRIERPSFERRNST
ncbi:hypothetical protein GX48_05962 [Paracoccidioides brasiliensis]|nr:hypothetical protein GX48_05962 [Paracoccidioides brasiliensis]